jgi:hypothetical protein
MIENIDHNIENIKTKAKKVSNNTYKESALEEV